MQEEMLKGHSYLSSLIHVGKKHSLGPDARFPLPASIEITLTLCVIKSCKSYKKGRTSGEHPRKVNSCESQVWGEVLRRPSVLDFKGDTAGAQRGIILIGQTELFTSTFPPLRR